MHLVNILRIITFSFLDFLVGLSILTISDFNSFRFFCDTLYIRRGRYQSGRALSGIMTPRTPFKLALAKLDFLFKYWLNEMKWKGHPDSPSRSCMYIPQRDENIRLKRQFFSMSRICDEKCSKPKIFLF
jgi:hypothetical protein